MLALTSIVFDLTVQDDAYYLPDGGSIQFFTHDKPIEFYGIQACLVRNCHIPGTYVIRVPADTAVYRMTNYKEMFEARGNIAMRNAEYIANGPYVHEREVGVNCGISELAPGTPSGALGQGTGCSAVCVPSTGGHGGGNGYYYMPATTPNFAVYPELMNRVQSYLDTTVSVVNSSIGGSDDRNPNGSTGGSSPCPGSANELFTQRHGSVYENNPTYVELFLILLTTCYLILKRKTASSGTEMIATMATISVPIVAVMVVCSR